MTTRRVVLVTGASGYLGSVIARACADDGWSVAVHYRSAREQAERLVADIRERGGEAMSVHADLAGDPANATRMVADVVEHFGHLDAVVNNSADQAVRALSALTDRDWQDMLQATFLAATRTTEAVVSHLVPGGCVVNVSSVEASSAFPNHAHYAAAKAAMESFTRSLALELGPRGMRANAVAPGLIEREGLAEAWPEGHRWWSVTSPQRRAVTAEEVAAAVVFLLDQRASGINGVVLPVDGGWSASARAPF
ncbi:MAG: SDR family NAD(P)-dependent oxidoreductase [Candidatus Nanopelagicales bacterium]